MWQYFKFLSKANALSLLTQERHVDLILLRESWSVGDLSFIQAEYTSLPPVLKDQESKHGKC